MAKHASGAKKPKRARSGARAASKARTKEPAKGKRAAKAPPGEREDDEDEDEDEDEGSDDDDDEPEERPRRSAGKPKRSTASTAPDPDALAPRTEAQIRARIEAEVQARCAADGRRAKEAEERALRAELARSLERERRRRAVKRAVAAEAQAQAAKAEAQSTAAAPEEDEEKIIAALAGRRGPWVTPIVARAAIVQVLGTRGPMHGGALQVRVTKLTGGHVQLRNASLYPALTILRRQGFTTMQTVYLRDILSPTLAEEAARVAAMAAAKGKRGGARPGSGRPRVVYALTTTGVELANRIRAVVLALFKLAPSAEGAATPTVPATGPTAPAAPSTEMAPSAAPVAAPMAAPKTTEAAAVVATINEAAEPKKLPKKRSRKDEGPPPAAAPPTAPKIAPKPPSGPNAAEATVIEAKAVETGPPYILVVGVGSAGQERSRHETSAEASAARDKAQRGKSWAEVYATGSDGSPVLLSPSPRKPKDARVTFAAPVLAAPAVAEAKADVLAEVVAVVEAKAAETAPLPPTRMNIRRQMIDLAEQRGLGFHSYGTHDIIGGFEVSLRGDGGEAFIRLVGQSKTIAWTRMTPAQIVSQVEGARVQAMEGIERWATDAYKAQSKNPSTAAEPVDFRQIFGARANKDMLTAYRIALLVSGYVEGWKIRVSQPSLAEQKNAMTVPRIDRPGESARFYRVNLMPDVAAAPASTPLAPAAPPAPPPPPAPAPTPPAPAVAPPTGRAAVEREKLQRLAKKKKLKVQDMGAYDVIGGVEIRWSEAKAGPAVSIAGGGRRLLPASAALKQLEKTIAEVDIHDAADTIAASPGGREKAQETKDEKRIRLMRAKIKRDKEALAISMGKKPAPDAPGGVPAPIPPAMPEAIVLSPERLKALSATVPVFPENTLRRATEKFDGYLQSSLRRQSDLQKVYGPYVPWHDVFLGNQLDAITSMGLALGGFRGWRLLTAPPVPSTNQMLRSLYVPVIGQEGPTGHAGVVYWVQLVPPGKMPMQAPPPPMAAAPPLAPPRSTALPPPRQPIAPPLGTLPGPRKLTDQERLERARTRLLPPPKK